MPFLFFARDLLNKLGSSTFLRQGEVQGGKESKQRMHPLEAPDDLPVGYQNNPQNNPQEIREQADTLMPRWATCVPPPPPPPPRSPPQKNKLMAWGKISLEETIDFKA